MKTSDIIKKLKNPTKPMLCLMVGFLMFFFGFMMIITKPKTEYSSNTTIISAKLSNEEAKNLMDSLLKNALYIYEKPSELFKVSDTVYKEPVKEEEKKETKKEETKKEESKTEEAKEDKKEEQKEETKEENNAILVDNYEEVIKTIFTEKAIKQLENMEFEGNKYVVKDSGKVYFLNNIIKKTNFFLNDSYSFGTPIIKEDSIKCNISFNRVVIDKDNVVNYELFIKELVLVKKDDKWLIDSFKYTNG